MAPFAQAKFENITSLRKLLSTLARTHLDGWCLADRQFKGSSPSADNTALSFKPCDLGKVLDNSGLYPSLQWDLWGRILQEDGAWEGSIRNRKTKQCLTYNFGDKGVVIGVPIPLQRSKVVGNLSTTACSGISARPILSQRFRVSSWKKKALIYTADTAEACENRTASLETSFGRLWLGCSRDVYSSAVWDIKKFLLMVNSNALFGNY
ncbi:hypothetical protein TWF970_010801 [Orbilia oligospora]|uniref:Uncharacterized protein n=1 Tax=Orbilia oligospora TaxID=2813651 RepID=A0A7C8R232_ORBOL|nr:hypothetical protein TWF970_010801 [Orbilia oligospora]